MSSLLVDPNGKSLAALHATRVVEQARDRRDAESWRKAAVACSEVGDEPKSRLCSVMAELLESGESPHVLEPVHQGTPTGGYVVAYKNSDGRAFVVDENKTPSEVSNPQLIAFLTQLDARWRRMPKDAHVSEMRFADRPVARASGERSDVSRVRSAQRPAASPVRSEET